jgi:hypothetical protein
LSTARNSGSRLWLFWIVIGASVLIGGLIVILTGEYRGPAAAIGALGAILIKMGLGKRQKTQGNPEERAAWRPHRTGKGE